MALKLYGFPGSPNTWKVRALAEHIGVPLDFHLVDLTKGEQKSAEFLAINPTGRTPALVDGQLKLWESTAILQYIAAQKKTPLWPDDTASRADIMRWQSWQLQHWAQACGPLLFERVVKKFFNLGPEDKTVTAAAEVVFHKEATILDRHLAQHSHLVNDQLTLADFSVASYLVHADGAGMPVAEHRHLQRWSKDVLGLPCWQKTAPQH